MALICKQITVHVKPGHLDAYLAAQEVWNHETAACPGYAGCFVGQAQEDPNLVHVHVYWRSRTDLDRFMAEQHDRIAALARADEHYERIEVRVLEGDLGPESAAHGL
ncbi:MAG: DUF4937 domain-containing protein [Phycisphaerales bacterium]|nr:DUF4937 domain-containing protein [Phycisphaerales bacterium]